MKKLFLLGCILLISACTMGTPSPTIAPPTDTATLPPPTEAASPTPSLAPTETASPTPEPPPPLYFTDEFDSASQYWQILQTGGTGTPSTAFGNSTLRVDIPSADTWMIGIHNANTYSNVFVRTKVSINPSGSAGLICRYDEAAGWFEFNISADGMYNVLIGEWLAEGIVQYKPVVSDERNPLHTGPDSEIGLFCDGDSLHLYVNNSLIRNLDVANYGLTGGRIGFTASSYKDAPMTAAFEWISINDK